jgi:hypothetical protein
MLKRMLLFTVLIAALCVTASAQYTTITGGNVQDAGGAKLTAGQICFLATDSNDNPISFQVGGGGQVVKRAKCANITVGVIGSLQVATPASTSPAGISYRVTVKDSLTNQEVIHYTGVQPTGTTWSFDNCACSMFTTLPLPTPASTSGNFAVNGNLTVTGTFSVGAFTPTTINASSSITAGGTITGPSLVINGGTALTTTSRTGTGNLVLANSPTIATPTITGAVSGNPSLPITGVATNSNAAAGIVGEFVASSAGPVSLTTIVPATVTSISLTAGDWDVSGSAVFGLSASATYARLTVSSTAATVNLNGDGSTALAQGAAGSQIGNTIVSTGTIRVSLSGTTTYYLGADAGFSSGTATVTGTIHARRVR